ncbi:MAG: ATP-dependent helicase [Sandaracinaceae bacterium]|nr:ATP-dependent helicase [Sandaracinaceae bacterium]
MKELKREGARLGEIAVLYRSNLQARPVEEELRANGIPYRVFGGTQFFDRKEVKDAIAYLRVVVNPRDELSLRRILNYPARGIGDTTIERIARWALAHDATFAEGLARIESFEDVPDAAKRGARSLFAALGTARERFAARTELAAAAKDLFVEVGLERVLTEEKGPVAQRRWGNVEYVLRSLARYEAQPGHERPTMSQFLTRLALNVDSEAQETGERVTLSSLHASKGLEFEVVFLIGLNEGQLPHSRTTDPKVTEAAPTDVEEERRLFYVGVTRARERLYLTRPSRRVMRGKATPLVPTRFLEGLPEEHVEHYERDDDAPMNADEAASLGKAFLAQLRGSS